ncbi:MAG: penicillin-binding protein [Candidatus Sericytochromatia bacterium]|nr:penicillin-binding protein [Candidatus Sericytochromatia bacterium]
MIPPDRLPPKPPAGARAPAPKKPPALWKQKLRGLLLKGLIVSLLLGGALSVGAGFALLMVYRQLPDVTQLENYTLPQATEIYTESGKLLTRISSQGRYDPVPINELPKHVQDAVISAEDRRFWQHEGVDFLGLMRAIYINLRHREARMGASTITQQLIKNLFLSAERTAERKIAEALLAFQLENKYTKHQILEMYLNLVFLGHNVYGVEAASQVYFGKSARQITPAEAALLAGIIRSPEYFSPYHRPDKANALKEIVLNQMAEDERITPEQHTEALGQQIKLVGLRTSYPHPYFLDYVMVDLREKLGDSAARQGGWKVYTTMDPTLQREGERLLAADLARLKRSGASQAALVAIDPRNGHIRTLVGGVDYAQSQFNRAFQAQRQVGSTFKPFVYLAGFEKGMQLNDTLKDEATSFGGYRPRNWDRRFRGEVTLMQALTWSINIPTVRLAHQLGIYNVIDTANRAGVSSPIAADLTSALGSSEMNLLELTGAYASFASGGLRVQPTAIVKIADSAGNVVWEHTPPRERAFDKNAVGLLNAALKNVINAGTGTGAQIGRPAAGKTGTTDQAYDTWFVGYVPQLVTGVWAGNDNPSPTKGGGGSTCAPLWRQFMLSAVRRLPVQDFDVPSISVEEPSASPEVSPTPEPESSDNSLIELDPDTLQTVDPVPEATPAQPVPSPQPTEAPTPEPTAIRVPAEQPDALMELPLPESVGETE